MVSEHGVGVEPRVKLMEIFIDKTLLTNSRDMPRRRHNYTKTIYSSYQNKTFFPRLLNTQ